MEMAWNEDLQRYIGCTFDNLRSQHKLTKILLQEQHYHCCYCMRKIGLGNNSGKVTLEHIVPFSSSESDFKLYFRLMPRFFKRKVFWARENKIAGLGKQLNVPPFPHYVAYENLTASCDGSIGDNLSLKSFARLHSTCNNFRGDKIVTPLFLFKKIVHNISYAKDGKLIYDIKYESTIENLNLDHPTLVMLRKTWYDISQYHKPEDVFCGIKDHAKRFEILEDTTLTEPEQDAFRNNDMLWELLTQYDWFYHYYKNIK